MPIAFSVFPGDFRTPGVFAEFDNSRAVRSLPGQEHRVLLIVQRTSAGTKDEGELVEVRSADDGKVFFGEGSIGHAMVERAKAQNETNRIFAIALDDDGAGAKAVGSLTFAGTATGNGTLNLLIGGRRVRVGVTTGMPPDALATAVAAAIEAASSMPVDAAVDGVVDEKVNLTFKHKGESGNDLDVRVNYNPGEQLPDGVSVTIVQPTGGTANPDIGLVFATIGDAWFNEIAMPYRDATNLETLELELEDRWGPLRQIEGHGFVALDGSVSALATFGNGENSPFLTVMGIQSSPTPAYEIAAVLAALVAAEAQRDPGRPMTTLPLRGVLAPSVDKEFTLSERNVLLHSGISTVVVGPGGQVQVDRLITTYQKNPSDTLDESYLDLNTPLLLGRLRYTLRARLSSRFARAKLARSGTRFGAGQPVITPDIARAEVISLFDEWESQGWVEDVEQFKDDLMVEIDENDPVRLNILVPPNLVNPLLQTAVLLQFIR